MRARLAGAEYNTPDLVCVLTKHTHRLRVLRRVLCLVHNMLRGSRSRCLDEVYAAAAKRTGTHGGRRRRRSSSTNVRERNTQHAIRCAMRSRRVISYASARAIAWY